MGRANFRWASVLGTLGVYSQEMLDHIVFATPDIAMSSEWIADLTGVIATEGGPHVNNGTRNRLCSFGDTYLEIIGPDPEQGDPGVPRSFGIDELETHRVVTWCARQHDLSSVVSSGAEVGLGYTEPVAMRRVAPDMTLDWHLSLPTGDTEGGRARAEEGENGRVRRGGRDLGHHGIRRRRRVDERHVRLLSLIHI